MLSWVEHEKSFIISEPDRSTLFYCSSLIICVLLWGFTDEYEDYTRSKHLFPFHFV